MTILATSRMMFRSTHLSRALSARCANTTLPIAASTFITTTPFQTSHRCASSTCTATQVSFSQESIDTSNKQHETYVSIQQTADGRGWGLFAMQDIPQGTRVFRGRSMATTETKDSHTVQIDWNRHVMMDLPAILVNHSCNSNLGIRCNDEGAYDFFALADIPKQSELLWDYETAEYEIKNFKCSCGAQNCRGKLKGFQFNGSAVVKLYGEEFISPYLLQERKSQL